jgi:TerC family integral membrane protein
MDLALTASTGAPLETTAWEWTAFAALLGGLLALDLFVHRGGRHVTPRAALGWSALWISAGLAFAVVVFIAEGARGAGEYLAAYAMEKSLSLDNMFVFLVIFRAFGIPDRNQHTALAWGIFGALLFRALFIAAGLEAMRRWSWMPHVLGGLLIAAAFQALRKKESTPKSDDGLVRWLARKLPVSSDSSSNGFIVREQGRLLLTPLLAALIAIELSDIMFAVDSVPAALAITQHRFIVYSSNAFAILGLRSLYLAIHGYLAQLEYLHYGLAAVLAFAGVKLIGGESLHLHPLLSAAIIAVCVGAAAIASVVHRRRGLAAAGSA